MKNIYLKENGEWKLFENPTKEDFDKRNIKIATDCLIGKGCAIGNDCFIEDCCIIASGCKIESGCVIGNDCVIGNGCVIESGCEIASGCKIAHGCVIESGCKIGSGIYLIRIFFISYSPYRYRQCCYIDENKHEGHIQLGCYEMVESRWTEEKFNENRKAFNDEEWAARIKGFNIMKMIIKECLNTE